MAEPAGPASQADGQGLERPVGQTGRPLKNLAAIEDELAGVLHAGPVLGERVRVSLLFVVLGYAHPGVPTGYAEVPATGLGAKQKSAVFGSAVADVGAAPVREARDGFTRVVGSMLELEHAFGLVAVMGREGGPGRSVGHGGFALSAFVFGFRSLSFPVHGGFALSAARDKTLRRRRFTRDVARAGL